ncbi:3-oxoacyl-ACP reductase [Porticoccaceae bacterium]|nr:3-oxoacyl-ACP reductase [Porticoccaceae bacterium]MDC1452865.1 3-oxoacyl-ACP reductase [Porticoccaceae bacterium]
MSDTYLELANSALGKKLFSAMGLPEPVTLVREDPEQPHILSGKVLVGASLGSLYGKQIGSFLEATSMQVSDPQVSEKRHLIFDASGIATAEQSAELYDFFHQQIKSLPSCGRVIVIGLKPSATANLEQGAVQRGLHGFIKSLAKEIGRNGSTANLLLVDNGGDAAIEAPIRFLLSAGSAFMNAQILTASTPVATMEADWQRPLQGKTLVVTGAARGIGLAIAEVLARDGATVIGVDVPQAEKELTEAMVGLGGLALPLDITSDGAATILRDFCVAQTSSLHGIIHNAGVTRDKMLSRMTDHQWNMLMQVNLGSVQRINAALLETALLDNGGKIVGVASISGIAGNVGQTNYAFSKSAVIGMVETSAESCAERGITINAVAPGFIETQMTAAIPFVTRQMGRRLSSLGQGGLPIDVAEVIGFFVSPQAAGINGNVVRVCGQSILGA